MGHRLTKIGLAAGLMFGAWKGVQALPIPRLTEEFNGTGPKKAENLDRTAGITAREYHMPSLNLPDPASTPSGEIWRIRMGSWEMAKKGHHTFLEFAPYCDASAKCPSKGEIYQIHGLAMDDLRKTHAQLDFGNVTTYERYFHDDYVIKALGVNYDFNKHFFNKKPDAYVDVFYGTKEEVLKYYIDGMKIAEAINRKDDSYLLIDQNSNSVQRTLVQGLGLPLPDLYVPHVLTAQGPRVWAPGLDVTLIPQGEASRIAREGNDKDLSAADLDRIVKEISRGDGGIWKEPMFKQGIVRVDTPGKPRPPGA